eukprot:IDg14170t1
MLHIINRRISIFKLGSDLPPQFSAHMQRRLCRRAQQSAIQRHALRAPYKVCERQRASSGHIVCEWYRQWKVPDSGLETPVDICITVAVSPKQTARNRMRDTSMSWTLPRGAISARLMRIPNYETRNAA